MNQRIFHLLIFLILLAACWSKEEEIFIEPSGKINYSIEIDQKEYYWLWNYYKYNADTLLVKIIIKDEVKELGERIYEYNDKKQVTTEIQSGPYLSNKVTYFKYDEKGRLIESTHSLIVYKYVYDLYDRLVEIQLWNPEDEEIYSQVTRYVYDSLYTNRIKFENEYLDEQNLTYSIEYKYDSFGNLFEKYMESDTPVIFESGTLEEIFYNNKNQMVKKHIYNRKIPPYFETEISYFYY